MRGTGAMAGLKFKRGQLALAFLCLVATDFVVRVTRATR